MSRFHSADEDGLATCSQAEKSPRKARKELIAAGSAAKAFIHLGLSHVVACKRCCGLCSKREAEFLKTMVHSR